MEMGGEVLSALVGIGCGFLALLFAALLAYLNLREPTGTKRMRSVAKAIKEGAMAYMEKQYSTILTFVFVVALLLIFGLGIGTAGSFLLGAFCSLLAGFLGMNMAVRSNIRTANAARNSRGRALLIAFRGGAVMGLAVTALGAIGIGLLYFLFRGDPKPIIGFSFGASSVALFARVGGGIFTKGADVGADLVGKVEKRIPEDDPRNPAVIADNVGDNVGDCAGVGADLFESYAGAIISTMVLGWAVMGPVGVSYPLAVVGAGIFASIIGILFVRPRMDPQHALSIGTYIAYILIAILLYLVASWLLPERIAMGVFYASIAGLIAGFVIGWTAQYYTSYNYAPVRSIARAAKSGTAITLIKGMAEAMMSTVLPVLFVSAAILISHHFAGMFGIAVAGLGMLSITAIVVSGDAYGPISDNAGGIVEMSGLGKKAREITDSLDSVGNTTKALTKGFAIGSAALTALALLSAFYQQSGLGVADLTKPVVLIGVLIGAMIPMVFSSYCLKGVSAAAFDVVEEVRRQWRTIKGIATGRRKPDYRRCVQICTDAALRELLLPGIIAILTPIVIGFLLGPPALAGLLAGATASGFVLAIFMANVGGAWDNAKKYIETGVFGGKGTPVHAAAVVGDTVGDPLKDTAGPALNILIKLMSIVALVLAPLL